MTSSAYAACTIVARNYLAQARVLARSFAKHHPDIEFFTLVIDGSEADRDQQGVGTVLLRTDLGLRRGVLHSMMLIYDVMELATALKPALLSELLHRSRHAVAYFDPDVKLYESVRDVFDAARDHGIVLTPHTVHPMPRDGVNLTERNIMQAGIFNLGFIAVGSGALDFLTWWHERLQTDAVVDIRNGLFTDQRWIDWVPALFPHVVSRDQGLNVAYWNLHERPIVKVRNGYRAGSFALRFFHFSGYEPGCPSILSTHAGDSPRIHLSEWPDLRELCDAYRQELEEVGHSQLRSSPYQFGSLANGCELAPRIRRLAREVLIGENLRTPRFPDPFVDPDAFVRWLTAPLLGSGTMRLSPAQWSVWFERPDLQLAFPDVLGRHSSAFAAWFAADRRAREWLASLERIARSGTVTAPVKRHTASWRRAFGWSVLAYANSELGVGEAGRRAAAAIAATGVPMELVGTSLGSISRQSHEPRHQVRDAVGFENVLTCVNADQLPGITELLGLRSLRGSSLGLWFWELERFPEHYTGAFDLVDEVWVASEFTRRSIAAASSKPVRLVRLPIEIPTRPTAFTRRSLGMPEGRFVYLLNFDYLSVRERKNPVGAIKAYTAAFGPDDGASLIVKSINGHHHPRDREHVRSVAHGRPDVLFMDDYVSTVEMKAMIELADCYVSLHRAEGYGLNLADAMAHGTPTIATGYSGNLDFMTDSTAVLVPYTITEVGPLAAPYDPLAFWADPDLDAAAQAMRGMFDDPDSGIRLAARALDHVREHHSLKVAAGSVRSRVLGLPEGTA